MQRTTRRWPAPERIDVVGLRAVENQMQRLAAEIDIIFDDIVPGWGFLVLALEFEGGGLSYVSSAHTREELIYQARAHSHRLRDRRDPPGVVIAHAPEEIAHALDQRQVEGLLTGCGAVAKLLKAAMPAGWGFALLLYARGGSEQVAWVCDADREDMAEALAEFADRLTAGDDRGPGVVGVAH